MPTRWYIYKFMYSACMCVYNVCVYADVYLKLYAMFYAIILEFLSISVLFSHTFFANQASFN